MSKKVHTLTISLTFAVEVDERASTADVEGSQRELTSRCDGRLPFTTEIFEDAAERVAQSFVAQVRDGYTSRIAAKYGVHWYKLNRFFPPVEVTSRGTAGGVRFAWDGVPVWPEEYRASGDSLCMCGKEYRKHPLGGPEGSDGLFLNVLCNGALVKL